MARARAEEKSRRKGGETDSDVSVIGVGGNDGSEEVLEKRSSVIVVVIVVFFREGVGVGVVIIVGGVGRARLGRQGGGRHGKRGQATRAGCECGKRARERGGIRVYGASGRASAASQAGQHIYSVVFFSSHSPHIFLDDHPVRKDLKLPNPKRLCKLRGKSAHFGEVSGLVLVRCALPG